MSQPNKLIHLPKVRMLRPTIGRPGGSIRITNVKSVKPADPETLKKQEEEKLRAQLQKEIMSRSRSCAFKDYQCTMPVLSGRAYCHTHILRDPTAPYKQCAHTYSNGDRCQDPAPIDQRDHRDAGMCFEHARAAMFARMRSTAPPPPVTTTETLLTQLQHYVRPERPRTTSCTSSVSVVSDQPEVDIAVPTPVDPFKQIDATATNDQFAASILECASASDSDCDSVTLGADGDCRGGHEDELDEFEETPQETQPLWRAGVFTVEEAVSEAKDALVSLQSAYRRQMGRLRRLLQMARGQYLKSLKAEKEQYCSINSQSRSGPLTVRERQQLRKLKAYAGYHRKHGVDAVLARKLHRKRAKLGVEPSNRPIPSQGRCTFTEGGVRCSTHVLPAAKHCLKHILHDRHQVLFEPCGDARGGGGPCEEAGARAPLPAGSRCRYHCVPPIYTTFSMQKDESDSDSGSHSTSDEGSQTEDFAEQLTEDRQQFIEPAPTYE